MSDNPGLSPLESLWEKRGEGYRKNRGAEELLKRMNEALVPIERDLYDRTLSLTAPVVFVVGVPRSGTTLSAQLLARTLGLGYITNFVARFWRAPLIGMRLQNQIFGEDPVPSLESRHGSTTNAQDLHEWGYFWKYWLQKDSLEGVTRYREVADTIAWDALGTTIANIQEECGRPMVFKNIYGAFHAPRISETLGKVVWFHIQRDPVDTAVSIYRARERIYGDPGHWWSYIPPDYERWKSEDPCTQIAGQIASLEGLYRAQLGAAQESGTLMIRQDYKKLCEEPISSMRQVVRQVNASMGYELKVSVSRVNDIRYSQGKGSDSLRRRFRKVFDRMGLSWDEKE